MGVLDQTSLFWEAAIEVAKSSGVDEVTSARLHALICTYQGYSNIEGCT